jgi:hypothetical protein
MCEQCQAVDGEDDRDALAAAFYSSYGKAAVAKPAPQNHAVLNSKAAPPAAVAKKVAR